MFNNLTLLNAQENQNVQIFKTLHWNVSTCGFNWKWKKKQKWDGYLVSLKFFIANNKMDSLCFKTIMLWIGSTFDCIECFEYV